MTKNNVSFKELTTLKIGGLIRIYFEPRNYGELISFIQNTKEPYVIIGNGSNIIPSDDYYDGTVICLKRLNKNIVQEGKNFIIDAGVMMPKVGHKLSKLGYDALFLSAIPGTIGGGVYMNAGAYNKEIKDVFVEGLFLNEMGELLVLNNQEMEFGYRDSILQKEKLICLRATFNFEKRHDAYKMLNHYLNLRKMSQPLDKPSAGSVFLNLGYKTWELIDKAGLRGYRINDAMISDIHANFIVNMGNASANDVYELYSFVKNEVFIKFGIELKSEWKFINFKKK